MSTKRGVDMFNERAEDENPFTTEEYHKFNERPPLFSRTLPYEAYHVVTRDDVPSLTEPEFGYYSLVDGSFAQIWKINLPVVEGATHAEINQIVIDMERTLREMPHLEKSTFQMIIIQNSNLTVKLNEYKRERGVDTSDISEVAGLLTDEILDYIRNNAGSGIVKNVEFYFTLVFTNTAAQKEDKKSMFSNFKLKNLFKNNAEDDEKSTASIWFKEITQFLSVSKKIESLYSRFKIDSNHSSSSIERVTPQELGEMLFSILNPDLHQKYLEDQNKYKPYIPIIDTAAASNGVGKTIREQVCFTPLELKKDHIKIGDYLCKAISAKTIPSTVSFANIWRMINSIDVDYIMAINFNAINKDNARILFDYKIAHRRADAKYADKGDAEGKLTGATKREAKRAKLKEFEKTLKRFTMDEALMTTTITASLISNDKLALDRSIETFSESLRLLRYYSVIEEDITPFMFRSTLPFGYDPSLNSFIARDLKLFSNDVANQLPVAGFWKPGKGKALLYPSSLGSLVLFDLFEDASAPHFIVVGATGTGKSFGVNYLITQYMRYNPYIYIIDKGGSYEKLASFFGDSSEYISLNPSDKKLCVNPLTTESAVREEFGTGRCADGTKFQLIDKNGFEVSAAYIRNTIGTIETKFDPMLKKDTLGVEVSPEGLLEINGRKGCITSEGDILMDDGEKIILASDKPLKADRKVYIKQILSEMITEGEERDFVLKGEKTDLGKAANEVFERDRSRQFIIVSDIIDELNRKDENGDPIYSNGEKAALKLQPYSIKYKGEYGGFFDRKPTIDLSKRLVIFETEPLTGANCKNVVLISIMSLIRRNTMDASKRGTKKLFLMDESWALLGSSDDVSAFVETAFREFRKYNCAVGCISQLIEDMADVAKGALLRNSPTQFFMRHKKLDAIATQKILPSISDKEVDILQTLKKVDGQYNQILLKTENLGSVKCLIYAMPKILWLSTTKPSELAIWKEYLHRNNGDVNETLIQVAEEFPDGIRETHTDEIPIGDEDKEDMDDTDSSDTARPDSE